MAEFSRIKDNKFNENHSPKKDIEGSQPISKLLSTYDTKVISGLEFSKKRHPKSHQSLTTMNLPKNLAGKMQLMREKEIFFKCTDFLKIDHP